MVRSVYSSSTIACPKLNFTFCIGWNAINQYTKPFYNQLWTMFNFSPNLVQLSSSLQKEKNMNTKLKLCTKYLRPYNMTKKIIWCTLEAIIYSCLQTHGLCMVWHFISRVSKRERIMNYINVIKKLWIHHKFSISDLDCLINSTIQFTHV
jgi:hypothetical protein